MTGAADFFKKHALACTAAAIAACAAAAAASLFLCKQFAAGEAKARLGEKAVMCLYDFGTVEELDMQMYDLQNITTEYVFNQLTIDNEERTLNTYLKFKGSATTVNVVRAEPSYVMYTLDNENVGSERHFVFFFDVGSDGRICYVREVEAVDFIQNTD